jgi:hypothetical protein
VLLRSFETAVCLCAIAQHWLIMQTAEKSYKHALCILTPLSYVSMMCRHIHMYSNSQMDHYYRALLGLPLRVVQSLYHLHL